jgi:hypothetical protein
MSSLIKFYSKNRDTVHIPDYFNEYINIGDFINSTKIIFFGKKFNKKLPVGIIPPNVKEIIFSDDFDQELEIGTFPEGIITIKFGFEFNKNIKKGVFPNSLINLFFGKKFSQNFEPNVLPDNLEFLHVCHNYTQRISKDILPQKLKKINLHDNIIEPGSLPNSLESLTFNTYNKIREEKGEVHFPPNLKYLSLPLFYNRVNDCIFPQSLEILDFSCCYDLILKDNIIPYSTHTVIVSGSHNLIINSLPDTIMTIVFSDLSREITNIPTFISKIKLKKKKYAKFIKKIPFGCEIVTMDDKIIEKSWF